MFEIKLARASGEIVKPWLHTAGLFEMRSRPYAGKGLVRHAW
jgi:hypothetical protein